MSDTSRRRFLAAASAGTAAGAVGVWGAAPAEAAVAPTTRDAASSHEPVVAYVEHPTSDVVRLMVGEREVVVDDPELAARILNAAGRK